MVNKIRLRVGVGVLAVYLVVCSPSDLYLTPFLLLFILSSFFYLPFISSRPYHFYLFVPLIQPCSLNGF